MLCGVSQALPRSLTPDGGAVTVARLRARWLLQVGGQRYHVLATRLHTATHSRHTLALLLAVMQEVLLAVPLSDGNLHAGTWGVYMKKMLWCSLDDEVHSNGWLCTLTQTHRRPAAYRRLNLSSIGPASGAPSAPKRFSIHALHRSSFLAMALSPADQMDIKGVAKSTSSPRLRAMLTRA